MLKIHSDSEYLVLNTYSRTQGLSHSFYIHQNKFEELDLHGYVVALDQPSFLTMRKGSCGNTVTFTFTWLMRCGDSELCGREESLTIPYVPMMSFIRASEDPNEPKRWAALALTEQQYPRLVFHSKRNLKAVLANRKIYRKLRKELALHFRWPGAEEIVIYDDFVPYSFGFTEKRNGETGICGGIIFHNHHNDLETAYYGVHT